MEEVSEDESEKSVENPQKKENIELKASKKEAVALEDVNNAIFENLYFILCHYREIVERSL